jgi:hypothetical protein
LVRTSASPPANVRADCQGRIGGDDAGGGECSGLTCATRYADALVALRIAADAVRPLALECRNTQSRVVGPVPAAPTTAAAASVVIGLKPGRAAAEGSIDFTTWTFR